MSYRIARKAPPAREVRRVLLEQNRKAQKLLATWKQDPAGHVHQSRQSFKRIRATLWLLRPKYRYVYTVENRIYRDLARQLAYARDASAMVEATDLLADRLWEPGPRQSLLMLRKSLKAQARQEMADAVAGLAGSVAAVRQELPAAAQRIEQLPLKGLTVKRLRAGARTTLAPAGRNYLRLDATAGPELYHDWRKHVKYAYYQTSLMAELMPRWSARNKRPLRELAELLGHVQDLHMLDELIAAQPDALGIDIHWQRLRRQVREVQRELQLQSTALGKQIFGKPRAPRGEIVVLPVRARRA